MYVSLVEVSYMSEVEDCEVMHDHIVALTKDGSLWYCNSYQKKECDLDDVPFYEAKPWMRKRWAQITGTGEMHINDQLRDIEIKKLIVEQQENDVTTEDNYNADDLMDWVMAGSFGNEYKNVEFELKD